MYLQRDTRIHHTRRHAHREKHVPRPIIITIIIVVTPTRYLSLTYRSRYKGYYYRVKSTNCAILDYQISFFLYIDRTHMLYVRFVRRPFRFICLRFLVKYIYIHIYLTYVYSTTIPAMLTIKQCNSTESL